MKFWDSSAIVPLLLSESATRRMKSIRDADNDIIVWWGARVECAAAVARRERGRELLSTDAQHASARLVDLAASWSEVLPSSSLRDDALRLCRMHGLRAGDALQLAAALAFANHQPGSLDFVCLDQRLAEAAAREGFAV